MMGDSIWTSSYYPIIILGIQSPSENGEWNLTTMRFEDD